MAITAPHLHSAQCALGAGRFRRTLLRRIVVLLVQDEGRRGHRNAMELTWNKQKRFPKYERMDCGMGTASRDRTLEFLQSLEVLFTPANAQLSHSCFQGRRFQAKHFGRTPLPPDPPVGRLQHVAKVLRVDFI